MEGLAQVLNKLVEMDTLNPKSKVDVMVKKAIIEFCQKEQYTQAQTLEILNEILVKMDKGPVTVGCVKHHWK
ncbi:hypothetical protein P4646_19900 [Peribacillus simplex]|uniref:hypothetical protein n=1 Tax=Peribacillus simplex TaxID=1478 RepID=UPI002E1F2F38|nr:hypothetical protein [Peribacillus simplex]MED4096831.1 hypothetical protein [Peribacillus simplex]